MTIKAEHLSAHSAQLEEQQLELARLAATLSRQPLEADPVARLLLAADEAARPTERADACSLPKREVRTSARRRVARRGE